MYPIGQWFWRHLAIGGSHDILACDPAAEPPANLFVQPKTTCHRFRDGICQAYANSSHHPEIADKREEVKAKPFGRFAALTSSLLSAEPASDEAPGRLRRDRPIQTRNSPHPFSASGRTLHQGFECITLGYTTSRSQYSIQASRINRQAPVNISYDLSQMVRPRHSVALRKAP